VEETQQVRLAVAMYPTASLVNHSCQPNTVVTFDKRRLLLRATSTIGVDQGSYLNLTCHVHLWIGLDNRAWMSQKYSIAMVHMQVTCQLQRDR
jgi:hypothetical protein